MNNIGYVVGDFNNIPINCVQVRLHKDSVIPTIITHHNRSTMFIHLPCNIFSCHNRSNYIGSNSFRYTRHLLQLTADIDCKIVIHFGSAANGGTLDNVIAFCQSVCPFINSGRRLLLENSAGQGKYLGWSVDELRYVYARIDKSKIGFCLDTQHLYGAAMIQMQSMEEVRLLLDVLIPITSGIDLIHLNDSKVTFGSRKDSHARLGQGYIWSSRIDILVETVNEFYRRGIPMIPETPDAYGDYLIVKSMIRIG